MSNGAFNDPNADPHDADSLETQLGRLRPRTDRLDRDRLMFLAGQAVAEASARRTARRWAWPAATGVMTAVAASLLAMLVLRGGGSGEVRIADRPIPPPVEAPAAAVAEAASPDTSAAATDSWFHAFGALPGPPPYLRLRNELLAQGGDAKAVAPAAHGGNSRPSAPRVYRELLEDMLEGPASPSAVPDRTSTENSAQGAHS
jgi:hypothetical protein